MPVDLPDPPGDRYFWRIDEMEDYGYANPRFFLALRKRTWWGSVLVRGTSGGEEYLPRAAESLLKYVEQQQHAKTITGDYGKKKR